MTEQARRLREKYKDDGLERLARANRDYCNTHGDYIPELAQLLLFERAAAEARVRELEEATEPLVAACEEEFTSEDTERLDEVGEPVQPDDEAVAFPSSHISFGMIRRARRVLGFRDTAEEEGA